MTGLHELGLAAAARAIRNGDVSSETYVGTLLERARAHAHLNAFITIDEAAMLEAARDADRSLQAGSLGSAHFEACGCAVICPLPKTARFPRRHALNRNCPHDCP